SLSSLLARPPPPPLLPYPTLFRSDDTYDNPWDVMSDAWSNAMYNVTFGALPKHINMAQRDRLGWVDAARKLVIPAGDLARTTVRDRKSTRLNSSHVKNSYAVFCLT